MIASASGPNVQQPALYRAGCGAGGRGGDRAYDLGVVISGPKIETGSRKGKAADESAAFRNTGGGGGYRLVSM
jgi:hypothetical protein